MKSPLRVGAFRASKSQFPAAAGRPKTKFRRIASLSAATAVVVGVAGASALFVDYLADRALARAVEAPVTVKPVVEKAVADAAETKVAALQPEPAPTPPTQPVEPPKAKIEAEAPDPAAVAKVAANVGPEHAIELPAEDPTASPILKPGELPEDVPSVDATVTNEEPAAADAEDASDGTETAAIAPYAAEEPAAEEPAAEVEPVKKPKRQKAEAPQRKPAAKNTEVASLPGVNVGGPTRLVDDFDTKPVKPTKNLGGMAPGPARVTAAVKLRTGPGKNTGVAGVVPAGSAVSVISCNGWCQIAYAGRTGWVYKNFLAASKAQPRKARSASTKQQAKPATSAAAPSSAPAERKAISSRADG